MLTTTLCSQLDALWNRFWSRGFSISLTAIAQMSYLIFHKRLKDLNNVQSTNLEEVTLGLYDPPFMNFGMNSVEKLFSEEDVKEIIDLTKRLVT